MSAIDKTCRSISRDLNGSKVPNIVHPFTDQSWVGERQVSGSSQMRLNGRFWGALLTDGLMLTERQLLAEAAVGSATAELRMLVDGCQFFSSGAVLPICEIPIQLTGAESILNSRYSADPLINFRFDPNCTFGP